MKKEGSAISAWAAGIAMRPPQTTAVICDNTALTYGELTIRADRLAAALEGRRAALSVGRADDVAVAVLAAVISGAGLLLIDARATPPERDRITGLFGANATLSAATVTLSGPASPDGGVAGGGLGLSTSGTEGPPKCVERHWESVTANAATFAGEIGLTGGDVVACTTPPHHSYSVCGGLIAALSAGAAYVSLDRMAGPRLVGAAIEEHRISVLLSVPVLYRWFATGLSASHRPRLCLSAGSPLPSSVRADWDAAVGWQLGDHYGCSEFGQLTVDTEGAPGSVGRVLPGIEITADDDGTLFVRADAPPPRLHGPNGTVTLDGAHPTGDLGHFDSAGRLYLRGRADDMINVGGNKVAAFEVEEAIGAFPGVRECAVAALPAAGGTSQVGAFVHTATELDRAALIVFLRARLSPYKVPTVVVSVTRLPRTASGKIRRSELIGSWTGSVVHDRR